MSTTLTICLEQYPSLEGHLVRHCEDNVVAYRNQIEIDIDINIIVSIDVNNFKIKTAKNIKSNINIGIDINIDINIDVNDSID